MQNSGTDARGIERLQREIAHKARSCEHPVVVDGTCWACGAVDCFTADDMAHFATLERDATGENVPYAGGYEN